MGDLVQFPGAPDGAEPEPTVAVPLRLIRDLNIHPGAIALYCQLLSEGKGLVAGARGVRRVYASGEVLDWLKQLERGGYIK